jgi:hypothetical protein
MRGPSERSDADRVTRTLRADERAAARLYAHCALISRMTTASPSRAQLRLEEELGSHLARILVAALTTNLRRGGPY